MKKILLITLIAYFFSLVAQAAEKSPNSLDDLKSKIKNVQNYLSTQKNKKDFYEKQLKESELRSSELARQLQITAQALKQKKTDLFLLETHATEYQDQLKLHEELLINQLKATYQLSQESYLKLILNQQDPEQIGRSLQYYRYIHQNRMQNITELKNLLDKIKSNQEQIKQQNLHLIDLKMQQQQEQFKLNIVQQDRKQAIASLNKEIQTKNQKLQELLANKRRLENTVSHLNQSQTQFINSGKSFPSLKGQLSWPTWGRIVQSYGTAIEQSELRATGVLIAAPLNQAVYAIAPGKVIFSKWMTGYGLLLIIDHGNHYMSLYGRNQTLYKKEGEVVKAGEQIASVGNSGGYQQPELYFALRHNADPLNPSQWMHGLP